jgi:nucleotide-binding universal stress UspA family protein
MKNILIATDFSKHSNDAIHYVINLVQRLHDSCHILLVNSYLIPSDTEKDRMIEVNDKLRTESQNLLKKEKRIVSNLIKSKNITIETISQIGSLHNVILNLIDIKHINLVVIGSCATEQLSIITRGLKGAQHPPLLVTYN